MVVDDVGQVIGGQFVGTLVEHLVVEDVALHTHIATNHVVDMDLLSRIDAEAHGVLGTVGDELLPLGAVHSQRVAHLHAGAGVVLEVLDLLALGLQLLRGVEGIIGLALVDELVDVFLVDVATLTLTIGTMVAAKRHALVELDAQPFESLDDVILGSGNEAIAVGVLNAEHQIAAMLACEKIVV